MHYPITLKAATLAVSGSLEDPAAFLAICAASRAPTTARKYAAVANLFLTWCRTHNRVAVPATDATLLDYLNERVRTHAVSTLEQDLRGIRRLHEHHGYPPPYPRMLGDFLAGARRLFPRKPRPAPPSVTGIGQLNDVIEHGRNPVLARRNRAMLLLGYRGALRRSEVLALDVTDIRFAVRGAEVTIRKSKTDPLGHGQTIGVRYAHDSDLCAVHALKEWMGVLGRDHGPLFPRWRGSLTTERLGEQGFYRWFKAATYVLPNPQGISPHSLRSAFVVHSLDADVSAEIIMRTTRHRSRASVHLYDRYSTAWTPPSFGEVFDL